MRLKDIRIGKRLFIGFGILDLLMVALIITGIVSTRGMNERLERTVSRNMAMIQAAYDVKDAIAAINMTTLASFSAKDEAYKTKAGEVVTANRARYKAATETIAKLETTTEGKRLLQAIKDGIVAGRESNNKATDLGQSGKAEEAVAMYLNEVLPQTMRIFADCDSLIKHEHKQSTDSAAEAAGAYHTAIGFIIFMGVLAIALATGLTLVLARSIIEPIRRTIAQARLLAQGNLARSIAIDRKDEFGDQAAAMRDMVEKWREIIGSVKQTSERVATTGTQLSAKADQMSHGASEQAERSHQVATASEEMSQSVEDIARNASSIATTATRAASTARDGGTTVEAAVKEVTEIADQVGQSAGHIQSLAELSQKIGDIIGIINEIADQTNLLALNAAIEAARAGEHGRGFAVVADEVRKLAERTTGATSEVSGIIREIQGKVGSAVSSIGEVSAKVERGVDLSSKAGTELKTIVASVSELQSMVQQIAAAIEEMSATSDQISKDIESISGISRETSRSSDEVLDASTELSRQAANLQDIARQFEV